MINVDVDVRKFSISRESKTFIADISELDFHPHRDLSRLTLVNYARNTYTDWKLFNCFRDADGDISDWSYIPTKTTITRLPQMRDWVVRIYND